MNHIVSETEFRAAVIERLHGLTGFDYVVGPGRSGAVAAVYASHLMGLPFVPYKKFIPGKRALVVDTATESGRTLRRAARLYETEAIAFFHEPPRVRFWYEELSLSRGKGNEYRSAA